MSVLDGIGKTPLVELRSENSSARIFAKLEWANPTGSMKDRVAVAMIDAAERSGRLRPGGTVVEYTAGTTGISLAFVCAARGYRLKAVFSDAFSEEKGQMMRALGAEVLIEPSDERKITADLIQRMIARASALSEQPEHWWSDQLRNEDAVAGYYGMGEEIFEQTGGKVGAFVHAVSTAHSILGTARSLRRRLPGVEVVAVEPAESAVLSGGPSGAHKIEGIGIGFLPPLWNRAEIDEIVTVTTEEAKNEARRLAREEGIFAGTSSGANVIAAKRIARRLGPGETVVTILCDSGLRYLSGDLYR